MPRKKISLTVRVFLITFELLLLTSLVTYGILAVVTPTSYVTLSENMLAEGALKLATELDLSKYDEAEGKVRAFLNEFSANVTIFNPDGEIDRVFVANDMAVAITENINAEETDGDGDYHVVSGSVNIVMDSYVIGEGNENGYASVSIASEDEVLPVPAVGEYYVTISNNHPFAFSDREGVYTLYISPLTYRVNMVAEAFSKSAPWLFIAVLVFSAPCSFFYSRFVARLRDTNAALEEREAERLAFFSAVSHELKTPITILKGQLTGMLDGVDVYRDRDKYLARALTVTGRLEGIVRELLTVARLGTLPPEGGEADISALIKKSLELYDELIQQKKLKRHIELTEGVLVPGDGRLLSKVLDNILSNAVFYSPEGADLTVTLAERNGNATLTVINGGVTIPADALPHLFEPFYRAEKSRSRATGGSGIGLYLVKTILEKQGAEYGIENTDGGVRFTIKFAAIR